MNFEIDYLDAAILRALMLDARASFTEIAKKNRTSTNTIRTRYNKLKKTGVITGSTIQIKPKNLGHHCVGQILIRTDFNERRNFIESLLKMPGIVGANFQVGQFNYAAFFSLENIEQLDELITIINSHINIKRTSVDVCVDGFNTDHPRNLIIEPTNSGKTDKINLSSEELKKIKKKTGSQQINKLAINTELDKIDYEILNLLLEDARMSFRKIGKKLLVSNQTIMRRYSDLKKTVIHSSTITLNLEKIGYFGIAIFRLRLSTDYPSSTIFKKIVNVKNVIIAYRTIGDFQLIVGMPFKEMDELISHFIKIEKIQGVKETQLFLPKIFPEWPVNTFSKM